MLRPILDYADYEPLAAECFGIDVEMVDYLFGAGSGNYLTGPIEAAARVRRVVAEHKKRLARKKAARARKRAEYIRLAKQIRMSPKAGMTAITTAVSDALAKVKEPV
jgi:hypothetical protein